MKQAIAALLCVTSLLLAPRASAQVDEDQLGAWYMYFWGKRLDNSRWGFQGDAQWRNWDLGGDLEQLLLRGGVTYTPENTNILLTLGYAYVESGEFDGNGITARENRTYQEALIPQKLGERIYLRHRLRYEQRWVDGQDFRSRFRYALFMDIPLNRTDLKAGAWYLAFYNEVFLNIGESIGNGRTVDTFDRDRLYGAFGYSISDSLRVQGGYMYQWSEAVDKGQLQLSLHQAW